MQRIDLADVGRGMHSITASRPTAQKRKLLAGALLALGIGISGAANAATPQEFKAEHAKDVDTIYRTIQFRQEANAKFAQQFTINIDERGNPVQIGVVTYSDGDIADISRSLSKVMADESVVRLNMDPRLEEVQQQMRSSAQYIQNSIESGQFTPNSSRTTNVLSLGETNGIDTYSCTINDLEVPFSFEEWPSGLVMNADAFRSVWIAHEAAHCANVESMLFMRQVDMETHSDLVAVMHMMRHGVEPNDAINMMVAARMNSATANDPDHQTAYQLKDAFSNIDINAVKSAKDNQLAGMAALALRMSLAGHNPSLIAAAGSAAQLNDDVKSFTDSVYMSGVSSVTKTYLLYRAQEEMSLSKAPVDARSHGAIKDLAKAAVLDMALIGDVNVSKDKIAARLYGIGAVASSIGEMDIAESMMGASAKLFNRPVVTPEQRAQILVEGPGKMFGLDREDIQRMSKELDGLAEFSRQQLHEFTPQELAISNAVSAGKEYQQAPVPKP